MLDDKVVGLAALKNALQIVQPLVGEVGVHCVEHRHFFIQHHIGVIGHAVGHNILPLEQINFMVVHSNILDIPGNFHCDSPLTYYNI